MKEEQPLVGVKELARLAGVSIGTIDRVLHDRPGVAAKTKAKVLAVLAEHDYKPNMIARALSSRKTKQIVVLIPKDSPESAYWQSPLQGVEKASAEIQPYSFQIDLRLFDQNDRLSFIEQVEALMEQEFDGLVLAPMFRVESHPLFTYCDAHAIPYVFLNSDIPNVNNKAYFGPDLFQSGCMAAQLIKYLVQPSDEILLVHISKEMEMQHHLLRKEEGVLQYMESKGMRQQLHKLLIRDTDYATIESSLQTALSNTAIRLILVTNSRVSSVARFLEAHNHSDIRLLGFDYLPDNIAYLEKEVIDFLFCHKPIAQGYQAVMSLFHLLENNHIPEKINYMPIDVISKENYPYYEN